MNGFGGLISLPDWKAYTARIIAILAGLALVFFVFPKKQQEEDLI
jgi:hypothetical protein